MAKVSIIVPIFNARDYLGRCVESLLKQTMKSLEIILVNDGSTDDSLQICHFYAKDDKRIRVIDKPNGGVSSARNLGLDVARGEYIGFVDPDDWVEATMYENMVNKATNNNADICICDCIRRTPRGALPILLPIKENILN